MHKRHKGKHYKKNIFSNIKINIKIPKWAHKFRRVCADAVDYVDNFVEELLKEIKELFLEIKMKIGIGKENLYD